MKNSGKSVSENIDMADPVSQTDSGERDGGKIHTMVQSPNNSQSREIIASPNTDNPVVPGNYHEFKGSQAKMYETYESRLPALEKALGNKAPLVS